MVDTLTEILVGHFYNYCLKSRLKKPIIITKKNVLIFLDNSHCLFNFADSTVVYEITNKNIYTNHSNHGKEKFYNM